MLQAELAVWRANRMQAAMIGAVLQDDRPVLHTAEPFSFSIPPSQASCQAGEEVMAKKNRRDQQKPPSPQADLFEDRDAGTTAAVKKQGFSGEGADSALAHLQALEASRVEKPE